MSAVVRQDPVAYGVPDVTADTAQRDAALALAAAGYAVFPVDYPRLPRCAGRGRDHDPASCTDRGKHPCVAFSMAATTNPKMIETWWAQGFRNIGIRTDGLLVIDEDKHGELERFAAERGVTIPATLVVSTAKGNHSYFLAPPGSQLGNREGAFGPYVMNVRAGSGSYVVGPGSLHDSGVVYAVAAAVAPVLAPDWMLEAVEKPAPPAQLAAVTDGWSQVDPFGDPPRGLFAVPDSIRGPRVDSSGERHNVVFGYASSLRARNVSHAEAEVLLRGVWARCEQPPVASSPMTWGDVQAILDDVWRRYPAGSSEPHSGALVVVPGPAKEELAEFWTARPVLAHIEQFAYARMVSPLALLGVLMLRVLAVTPPWVVLPPLIGGRGSLNGFIASVGPSGAGKGVVDAAAIDAINFVTDIYMATVGSGEGLVHQYGHREKGEVVYDRTSVLFSVTEVDTLAALKGRDGSTLLPQLRSAFSGEQLGFSYAAPEKRIPLSAHTYRLVLSVGVQPERAQTLMADADGGTPQRFVWLPVTDPAISEDRPPEPDPLLVPEKGWQRGAKGFRVLHVPEIAAETVLRAHVARNRGEGDALDGHALFVRLKVAQALAMLDRRQDMDEEDWRLAGVVMKVSDATRASVVATLSQQLKASDRARGVRDADRTVVTQERVADHRAERISRWALGKLNARPDREEKYSDLRRALSGDDRPHFEEALERLVSAGQVELVEGRPRRVRVVSR